MTSPIERYRAREPKALEHAHRDGPPPEPMSFALVTQDEAKEAAGKLGIPLEDATAIILRPPGNKPWPYRHFSVEQVKEIGAIVSEWLKIKLATIQTDAVDELLSKNKALTHRVGELSNEVAGFRSEMAKLRNELERARKK
jgi:hypothetical protein